MGTTVAAVSDLGDINPDDLKRCGADVDALLTRFSSDFITCQTAFEEVYACGEASVSFIKTIIKLVSDAETKTVNPYTWYEDAKDFFGTLAATIDACRPA